MFAKRRFLILIPIYFIVLSCLLLAGIGASRSVDVYSETMRNGNKMLVILDPGHGSPDGGAVSCSGRLESDINLEIALRLDDLMHFIGYNTVLTRHTGESVYTQGNTISEKKISDMRNRVELINNTQNAIVISIHQNYFSNGKYSGAQVFYRDTPESKDLATQLQNAFVKTLNPGSKRQSKRGEGIYLLEKVKCPAVLIECGFLSNPEEDFLLQEDAYQKKISCVVAVSLDQYINDTL